MANLGTDLETEVADLEALREELRRTRLAYRMAVEMAQFQAGFLARTSHELRSPINSVISLHQLILSDLADSPEEEREFIAQSFGAAEKMLATLDQLIQVSKALHGTESLDLQPLPLQSMLTEVQTLTHLQARNRNLRLEITLPEADLFVMADARWFQQVMLQLVDSPILLMREGTIRVTTAIAPPTPDRPIAHAQIQVEDERPASFWSEPLDLLEKLRDKSSREWAIDSEAGAIDFPSPAFSLLTHQTLMELMGGSLEVLSVPSAESPLTCIQCSIPIAEF
jgi:hypothetical protein